MSVTVRWGTLESSSDTSAVILGGDDVDKADSRSLSLYKSICSLSVISKGHPGGLLTVFRYPSRLSALFCRYPSPSRDFRSHEKDGTDETDGVVEM